MATKQLIVLTDETLRPPALIRAGLDAVPPIYHALWAATAHTAFQPIGVRPA
jgi:hypothetical protein